MHTAPRATDATVRLIPTVRRIAVLVLLVGFVVVIGVRVADSVRVIGDLDRGHRDALGSRSDTPGVSGDTADAFRRFRPMVRQGQRFALVFTPDVGRDQEGFYRLVALSYLYPAIAVEDLARADAVMVFGQPSSAVRAAFDEADVVAGVWLGSRRR